MSHIKPKTVETRKSPVSPQNTAKSVKPKLPKGKVSKGKPVSNGFHEVRNKVEHQKGPSIAKEEVGSGVEKRKSPNVAREEDEVAKINLLTLQKVDGSVSEIVDTVPHVVLYEFKTAENMWERTSSEGTLFVYNRSRGSPRAGFMILNRLNSDNTQEAIVPGMEFRLQPPFILYGKESGSVFGLCIQAEDRCVKTRELLNRLSSEASSGGSSDHSSESSSSSSSYSSSSSSPPAQGLSISPAPLEGQRQSSHQHRAGTGNQHQSSYRKSDSGIGQSGQQHSSTAGNSHQSKADAGSSVKGVKNQQTGSGIGQSGHQHSSTAGNSHQSKADAGSSVKGVKNQQTGSGIGQSSHQHSSTADNSHQSKSDAGSTSVDILEVLETAGRSYLGGQCFSDDTDSHDETHPSPPKATRTQITVSSDHNSAPPHKVPVSQMVQVHSSPNLSSAAKQSSFSLGPTSPREIPQRVGVSQPNCHQSPQKPLVGSSQDHQRKMKTSSPNLRQTHQCSTGQGSLPATHRAPIHHSASFDQVRSHGVTPEGTAMHYGGGRSNSMFGGSPCTSTPVAGPPGREYHSAYLPSRAHSAAAASTGVAGDSIVRKLFTSEMPPQSVPSTAVSVSLQTLFSQAQAATPNSGIHLSFSSGSLQGLPHQHHRHPAPPPLVSALSLDEIEKKMTEEAPSPKGQGTTDFAPKMAPPTSSASGENVLLQPSAFVIPPPVSSTASQVIQQPSPLVTGTTVPQVFPAIPPLMHSAGMTAPPLNTRPNAFTTVSSSSPSKAKMAKVEVSSNQIQPAQIPSSHRTPKEVASVTAAKEHISAVQEIRTPPSRTTTAAATKSSAQKELSVLPGRSFTTPGATLMSPQQFSHGRAEGKAVAMGTSQSKKADIGLTREQMQEALVYMIENDHGFVDKLHEAYKSSLARRLS